MTEKDKFLVFLSLFEISIKKQETLLEKLNSFSLPEVLSDSATKQVLTPEELEKLENGFDEHAFNEMLQNMESRGIGVLTIFSSDYPKSLADLPERPLTLFYKGDLTLLDKPCFAIVGTRNPTTYGRMVTEKFAKELAESGFVIVSGLCYGTDSVAHKGALDVGGKTIAVIGSGFNHIYPATNKNLAGQIARDGLILSEYPPTFTAKRYTFPRRNRIVAGLSRGVLITEAGFKSGTIHTKEFALEYGKDIFAVPGNVTSEKSQLPNQLIQTAQAECTLSPDEIVRFYGMEKNNKAKNVQVLSFDEQAVLNLLENEPQSFDFLAEKTKIPVNILTSCLTMLEIRGLIKKLPAQMYARQ